LYFSVMGKEENLFMESKEISNTHIKTVGRELKKWWSCKFPYFGTHIPGSGGRLEYVYPGDFPFYILPKYKSNTFNLAFHINRGKKGEIYQLWLETSVRAREANRWPLLLLKVHYQPMWAILPEEILSKIVQNWISPNDKWSMTINTGKNDELRFVFFDDLKKISRRTFNSKVITLVDRMPKFINK